MTAEPESDLVESVAAMIEIDQRRVEEIAAMRDALADEALSLRKAGMRDHAKRLSDHSATCARLANEMAVGIVAQKRLLDAAKTVRLSVSSLAGG